MPSVGIYLSDSLNARLQRLKDRGVDLNTSAIAQRALEANVEGEEAALGGDRLRKMVHRLKAARSPVEQAEAEGIAAGRAWAEDLAALSELKRVAQIREDFRVFEIDRLVLEPAVVLLGHDVRDDRPAVGSEQIDLPESVPGTAFERVFEEPRYWDRFTSGFFDGATEMLDLALAAMQEATPIGTDDGDVDPDDIPF